MTTDTHNLRSRLSTDLAALRSRMKDQSLTLGEFKLALRGRGSAMLLVLLALPFCFVAIPGLSIPFGIAICCIGARMMIGREPWLPRSILHRRLSTARSHQLLTSAIKLARMLESFVRPRFGFLHAGPVMPRVTGLGIVIASLGLMLPLPIPFSNSIPAWAVILLAIGTMEKDGLCVLLGYLTVVATWVFIGLTSMFAIGGIQTVLHSLVFPTR
jgi:hypothetical protein